MRVSIFRSFVRGDARGRAAQRVPVNPRAWLRALVDGEEGAGAGGGGRTRIQVRRGRVAEDGFDKLAGVDLKGPVEITFVDQFGAEECVSFFPPPPPFFFPLTCVWQGRDRGRGRVQGVLHGAVQGGV